MHFFRFYRVVLEPTVVFDSSGGISSSAYQARFSSLPNKQLLTLSLIPPDSWIVEVVSAMYDLDNIRMEQVRMLLLSVVIFSANRNFYHFLSEILNDKFFRSLSMLLLSLNLSTFFWKAIASMKLVELLLADYSLLWVQVAIQLFTTQSLWQIL